ncbi:MAG: lipoyl synthase [Planctomycetes bacterium]|nr:lipoyl synthase [Planctomycetota bacterium]
MPVDAARRKPDWLKVKLPSGENVRRIQGILRRRGLNTVCEEARCPNLGECWGGGTATFMLLGDTCTRGCRFCAVQTGNPRGRLDPFEPAKVAASIAELSLEYIVLTSVDRDDLPDQGAAHFARTIREVRAASPGILIEALIPDFRGDRDCLAAVVESRPDVLSQNVETVEELTARVRDPRAGYRQTLQLLRRVKELDPRIFTKSSLMLGLGERPESILRTMDDLRAHAVDILTLGQYLQPTKRHLPVEEYVPPARFAALRDEGEARGFLYVASGPLVRSSYRAGEFFLANLIRRRDAAEGRSPATCQETPR